MYYLNQIIYFKYIKISFIENKCSIKITYLSVSISDTTPAANVKWLNAQYSTIGMFVLKR